MMDFNDNRYTFKPGLHNIKKVIWVIFEKNQEMIDYLKRNTQAFWSQSNRCWYVADNSFNRNLFKINIPIAGKAVISKINLINLPVLQRMQEQLVLKGYSQNTIKTYTLEFAQLLYALKSNFVDELTPEKLRSYFLYCHKTLKLSENEIHSRMNAVKFYFEQVLHREKMFFDIPRPKKHQQLPKALNKIEIKRLFNEITNPKHKLIIQLCYGMGLRVSEIIALKISDIDSVDMVVRIERSKGKKDRIVALPKAVLEDLRKHYIEYKPKEYLFEGQSGGQYAARSVQAIFKNAMKKAKINKTVGVHGLRHSYATHLLELGTDVRFIQKLLGHSDIKTTLIYTNIANSQLKNVVSPLDQLSE